LAFSDKRGLQPAAAHGVPGCAEHPARLQAEKSFFRRTRRRKKRFDCFRSVRAANSARLFRQTERLTGIFK
jgi:hypothetical protein